MPQTCLIIPCYNEASRLDVNAFGTFLGNEDIHLCFVDDGSIDDTVSMLQQLKERFPGKVLIKQLPNNQGKASAVREGVLFCMSLNQFTFLGYYDADLSTPLSTSKEFCRLLLQDNSLKIVFGSRIKTGETFIQRNYWRHIGGRLFSFIINHYLHIKLYDTQCGAKVFNMEAAGIAFAEPFLSRWLFDIEIILRLRRYFNKDNSFIKEVALPQWINKRGSKITANDLLHLPAEIMRIKRKYSISS